MRSLREIEDYVLLIAVVLAAVSDALQADSRYSIWAITVGAAAKALMSILSRPNRF